MPLYTIQAEAKRLLGVLIGDDRLRLSPEVKKACEKVDFSGHSDPWLPVPCKFSESISAMSGFVAAAAATVAKERYGIDQEATVNTDKASLTLMGFFRVFIDEVPFGNASKAALANALECDLYHLRKPIHRGGMNHYRTKDNRIYHVHGSMNAGPIMKMLGIEEQDVNWAQAKAIYGEKVAQWDSKELDRVENDVYRQAGTICYTPEEFFETEHGRITSKEPIATVTPLKAPQKPWPAMAKSEGFRPLEGIRVIDMSRAVAAPMVSKILAALGADVIKISSPTLPDVWLCLPEVNASKRDVSINLKTEDGKAALRKMLKDADVVIDGYRPNALAKLGFDVASVREINPSIIFVREACYGFNGPWAHRSGWQQIADCVTGIAVLMGRWLGLGDEAVQPILPNADYETGVLGAGLVVNALKLRATSDVTFNIDLSLVHYDIWLYRNGVYDAEQQKVLREKHSDMHLRYNNDLLEVYTAAQAAVEKLRPGILMTPDYYTKIPGKEWGEERDISITAPPFDLSVSTIGFKVPSGRRGWSNNNPDWLPIT